MDQRQFNKGLTQTNPNAMSEDLQILYRGMHPQLLADQLIQLGLFGTLDFSAETTARHNYAVELLRDSGILEHENGKITIESMTKAVRNLLGTEPDNQKEQ